MSLQKKGPLGPPKVTATQEFIKRMTSWEGISDGSLSARIVGEFSAGKTRLLSAVLGGVVPEALTPVSSRDVQTRLPLEVTYGEEPLLTVVEYAQGRDLGAKILRELEQFPTREQIVEMVLDPELHRLRLSLPLAQLVLPNGDFFDDRKTPKRLFLIDMPGWNSIDDHIAEEKARLQMAGGFNLALVYVVNASRLDSAGNRRRLAEFMEVLADAEFIERARRMLLVITHCDKAESERVQARAAKQVEDLWTCDIGMALDELQLTILSAEFDTLDADGLESFRGQFWQALLAPLGSQQQSGHPWGQRIRAWDGSWRLAPKIEASYSALKILRDVALRGRQGELFMPGMNMHRLKGLEPHELLEKLRQHWRRQTHCNEVDAVADAINAIALDAAHPLGPWWAELWHPQLEAIWAAVHHFFDCADEAFREVTANTLDLESHLTCRLGEAYAAALAGVHGSFARLLDVAFPIRDEPPEKLVATVLSLLALQQRFDASCIAQLQLIDESVA